MPTESKAKGFQLPSRPYTITFEGTEFEGAEVVVRRRVSLGAFFELVDMAGENYQNHVRLFAKQVLMSWNLLYGEDFPDLEGQPIPATPDGIMAAPPDLVTLINNK